AETIGADAMLCRVGSYYHDIGKLEHPEMFTENQDGFNIHDTLEPEESVRYIIGHVAAGLKTARRYRLPLPIQKIITEHRQYAAGQFLPRCCGKGPSSRSPAAGCG